MAEVCSCAWLYLQLRHAPKRLRKIQPMGDGCISRRRLVMIISCGVPGTSMPHFDELAYTDKRCYGMTEAELGGRAPALPPSTTLPKREIEVLADYLLANVIGRGRSRERSALKGWARKSARVVRIL